MLSRMLHHYGLLVWIVAIWLAACGELPRPFHESTNPLAQPDETVDIVIAPLSGIPEPLARQMAGKIAEHLGRIDIPAVVGTARNARYRLIGTVNDTVPAPDVAVVHWLLLDADGNAVGVHDQGIGGTLEDFMSGEPRLLERIGAMAARALARVTADADSGIAPPAAGSLMVEAVQGAPGDGNGALARAMRQALVRGGLPVVDAGYPSAYRLLGEVDITPPQAGRQAVRIVWRVVARDGTPSGRAVGRAAQENVLAAGSLDGAWGEAATAIASAAAQGIADIIKRDGGS